MVDDTFVFRVLGRRALAALESWRIAGESARSDRHYLLAPGYSLRLTEGRRVELARLRGFAGLRRVQTLADAAFPLGRGQLAAISGALPAALRGAAIDGTTAQGFVESLARAALPQANVLARQRRYARGTTIAVASHLSVPAWAAETVAVSFESDDPPALRAVIAAAGLGAAQHADVEDWLGAAYHEWLARIAKPHPAAA